MTSIILKPSLPSSLGLIKVVPLSLELVSKELAAILHVYAKGLNVSSKKTICYYFSKRKWKYFYPFNHFYSEKSSKRAKYHKSTTMTPNLLE